MSKVYDKLPQPAPERLASLPEYPSGQYLYHDWKHDTYQSEDKRHSSSCSDRPKAVIRNAMNQNID